MMMMVYPTLESSALFHFRFLTCNRLPLLFLSSILYILTEFEAPPHQQAAGVKVFSF